MLNSGEPKNFADQEAGKSMAEEIARREAMVAELDGTVRQWERDLQQRRGLRDPEFGLRAVDDIAVWLRCRLVAIQRGAAGSQSREEEIGWTNMMLEEMPEWRKEEERRLREEAQLGPESLMGVPLLDLSDMSPAEYWSFNFGCDCG